MSGLRKTVKRFHHPGDCHELTFSCYRRMPLLTNDVWCGLLAEGLERAVLGRSCRLVAYVFMPEHVHILVRPATQDARIDRLLKAIKAPVSARVRRLLEDARSPLLERLIVRERPGVHCFRFWQAGGGYDRNLRTVEAVEAAIAYIHENPVRRRLGDRSTDWRWSSARHYAEDLPRGSQRGGPPTIHGLSWDFYD
jgi:putative transposase